jgi:hypothetical protein
MPRTSLGHSGCERSGHEASSARLREKPPYPIMAEVDEGQRGAGSTSSFLIRNPGASESQNEQ